jgi:hypothetical protein
VFGDYVFLIVIGGIGDPHKGLMVLAVGVAVSRQTGKVNGDTMSRPLHTRG